MDRDFMAYKCTCYIFSSPVVFVLPHNLFRHVSSAVYFSVIFRFLVYPSPLHHRWIDDNDDDDDEAKDTIDTPPLPRRRRHRRKEMWQIAPVWRPFVSFGPVPISQTQTRLFFVTVGGIYKFFKNLSNRSVRSRRRIVFRRSRRPQHIYHYSATS